MTEQEAIKYLQLATIDDAEGEFCELYKEMCEMSIKAIEKQIAKKPIENDLCTCPNCHTYNEVIKKRRNTVVHDIVYCWHCGQALEVNRGE